jgi:hypothetical protein
VLAGLPAGLAIASAAWLLAPPQASSAQVARIDTDLARIATPRRPGRPAATDAAARAIATPLFGLTTGPGAVVEVPLKLEGLVRAPGRVAALLSINGAPSDWLALGETRDGVTLQDVGPGKVVVDTAAGLRELLVGQTLVPPPPAANSPALALQTAPRQSLPRGMRLPPPPADAPHGVR